MNHSPLISVITVTYNAAPVIDRTIQSVAGQNSNLIEHIFIDGLSSDSTLKLIYEYQKKQKGCYPIYTISEKDQGLYDAMNKAIKLAQGDYLIFLNAGDTFHSSDTIQLLQKKISEEKPAIIYGDTNIVNNEGKFISHRHLSPPEQLSWKNFKNGMMVCHQAFIVKTDIARHIPYNLDYHFSADFDWCIKIMKEVALHNMPIINSHLIIADFLQGGLTGKYHKRSLWERFKIMVFHYGLISTIIRHVGFLFRWQKRQLLHLLILFTLITSCGHQQTQEKTIFVSIEPLCYFVQQLAGQEYQIISFIPKGSEPETYDPTPSQIMRLSSAKAFIKVGNLGLENSWLENIHSLYPDLPIINSSDSLSQDSLCYDPHIWTSPKSVKTICKSIYAGLCQLNPDKKEIYKQHLDSLLSDLSKIDTYIEFTLKDIKHKTFLAAHPSLSRFAHHYNLHQLCIEENGKEPNPESILNIIKHCKKDRVRVIFIQPGFPCQNAEIIARETKAKIIEINPLNKNWPEEMLHITNALKNE